MVTKGSFDCEAFLSSCRGRKVIALKPADVFFSQGTKAESVFYLITGRAKLTVVSDRGKEMIVALLSSGDFLGEVAIAPAARRHTATAVAMTHCTAIKIGKSDMAVALSKESDFSKEFIAFLLSRSMRVQEDLVDHLFHSSERRLARVLLILAETDTLGSDPTLIPHITQEMLAGMIGTTRSRVSYFMNRFRKRGLIEYNRRIRVHSLLLKAVLEGDNAKIIRS
ncbi:cAMP-binding domain of CRP or a regulatory subunit of cAMP-dependent protein kinases [Granulicella pectinivorans]|uniref:cAMP-binding domain of CRP or a regulatory subunit of cAMP-dependent protein kinases n=1 Tax=Granulicella pectinivorans TaxID=474950 RepID=A0A1I6LWC0_9BACT|nr:cAMP-binding domain of CRP or a regulatory subunit of cAMP-dependent protein kinases [Granulicella pectinivorans]